MTSSSDWNQDQPQPTGQPPYPPPSGGQQPYPGQAPGPQQPFPGQYPPGQPPFGGVPGPYPPQPPDKGGGRTTLVLGAVSVVVLAAVGVVLYLVLGRDGDSSGGSGGSSQPRGNGGHAAAATPLDAATAWLTAVKKGDVDAVEAASCTSFAAEIAAHPVMPDNFAFAVKDVTQRNGRTIVVINQRVDLANRVTLSEQDLVVVKEHGQYKVCAKNPHNPENG